MKRIIHLYIVILCFGGFILVPLARTAAADTVSNSTSAPQSLTPSSASTPQMPSSPAAAQTPTGNPPAPATPPTTFWTQNYLTGNWGGFRDTLKNGGIALTPTLYTEVFGNPSGGARQGIISDGLVDLTLDVDLDALSSGIIKDTIFHTEADYIYGPSLSEQYVGDFSDTSNIAGFNTLRLQELWLQKLFWDKKLSLKVGNMAVDDEYFQSTSASLFISGTFGAFTFIANNVTNAPVYPLAAPGVRLQLTPTPAFYVMAGVYGQDNNSNPATNNQNGLNFALNADSGMLIMSEAGYLLNQGTNAKGLQGTYRVGSWVDTGNHSTFISQANFANGTGPLQSVGTNYGVYGVLDQQIYAKDTQIISFFVRSGGAPSNTNFVDYYAEGGFNFTGFIPGRDNDIGGIAVARSHVSDDYGQSQILQGNPPSSAETVIEATYKVQIAPWWSIQPDLQYIVTPSGVQGSKNATVLGLRTTVAF
ncbi:MAG: carbohydrate porin [Methylacidiphilales bacterium]|nr:carbohydrate porin [Candidatus Methylacidiphilales bacterium]